MVRFWVVLIFLAEGLCIKAQDSTSSLKMALILPFQTSQTAGRMSAYTSSRDVGVKNRIKMNADAETSLNYYQGALLALERNKNGQKIDLSVFDCANSDSITKLILNKPELKEMDVIIGAVSTSNAKLVADYCKNNKIVNVQPFSPSKSLAANNPYHLKLAPTLDAHVDAMFHNIVDSFPGANIILYTPPGAKSTDVASRFDSLLKAYNQDAKIKFTVSLLNTKDMMLDGKKTSASALLKSGKYNVWVMTSFDESFVNGNMRVLYGSRQDKQIILYGMPTWLNGDVLRLDYISDYRTRLTDAFYVDSNNIEAKNFIQRYTGEFKISPDRSAHLGYDVTRFIIESFGNYGKEWMESIASSRYKGTGYYFDIIGSKVSDNQPEVFIENSTEVPRSATGSLENRHVNVFRVHEYRLIKAN